MSALCLCPICRAADTSFLGEIAPSLCHARRGAVPARHLQKPNYRPVTRLGSGVVVFPEPVSFVRRWLEYRAGKTPRLAVQVDGGHDVKTQRPADLDFDFV